MTDFLPEFSAGHLALFSKWEIGEVDIMHVLHGDNYKVEHVLEYSQEAASVIEESLREEEDKSKLKLTCSTGVFHGGDYFSEDIFFIGTIISDFIWE